MANAEPPHERAEDDRRIEGLIEWLQRLGVTRLPREIVEEEIARRRVDQQSEANYWQLNNELWQQKEDRLLEGELATTAALFDKSSSYNNVVSTLGYAGFFFIWNFCHDSMTNAQNAFVGVFLGFSLLVFISWTLLISVVTAQMVRWRAAVLEVDHGSRQELLEAVNEVNLRVKSRELELSKYWLPVFCVSVGTALAAGIFLLALLFSQMTGLDLSGVICYIPPQ